jgi:UDP-N-acetylmuramate--alanine ligase
MSAIAEILVAMGHTVSGSDPNDVPILARLRDLGVSVAVGDRTALPGGVATVVRSSGTADDHPEVVEARRRGIPVLGRPAVQGAIARTRRTIAVSGTHGKTSTTAMLAHVLDVVGADPSYIVGGDLGGDAGGVRWGDGEWFVVEADESDGTFLELGAERVVVTNVDADHLDHYGTIDAIADAFEAFVAAADAGAAVVSADDPIAAAIGTRHGSRSFGFSDTADVRITDLLVGRGESTFVLWSKGDRVAEVTIPEPGRHNALNATAAVVAATEIGIGWSDAASALASYRGVGRRFETRGVVDDVTVVDDYAHNPGKVRAVVEAAAGAGWDRVVVVFQPHRFSRTEDLWHEFGSSFDGADLVVVTELDPAGEAARPGISGQLVAEAVRAARPTLRVDWVPAREDLVEHVVDLLEPGDLCLSLGAGDITLVAGDIVRALESRRP